MFIVWYGDNGHDFLVQTDDVETITNKAITDGYIIKDIVRQN